jgi:uncharacterized protein YjbJ (UPF0337 family)/ElaB/YqjD/DUF883 family membrane-anchored ribosome-binding protein
MTTKQELEGDWNTIAGNVKEKYGQITDDELRQVEGNADQLIGLIQRRAGQTREQAAAYVDSLCQGECSTTERVSQLAREYAESTSHAVQEGYQQVADRARQGYEQTADAVAHRPMESVFAALSIGLITGIAIGISIGAAHRPEPTWRDRWTP